MIAAMRPSIARLNANGVGLFFGVCVITEETIARMFFTRWSSSAISSAACWPAAFRSVMSTNSFIIL